MTWTARPGPHVTEAIPGTLCGACSGWLWISLRCSSESAAQFRWRERPPIHLSGSKNLKPSVVINFSTVNGPIVVKPGASFASSASFVSGGMAMLMRSVWNSPVCFLQLLQDSSQRFPFRRDQFGHEQAGENSVLLRHVAFHAQSAGFFAADNDRLAFHQCADVFEADRRLVDFHAEQLRDGIDLMAGRNGANHRAGPAAILFQMIQAPAPGSGSASAMCRLYPRSQTDPHRRPGPRPSCALPLRTNRLTSAMPSAFGSG